MPAFAVIFEDDLAVEVPDDVGARHRDHFVGLGARAILGGPTFGESQALDGRMLIGEFASLEEARAWADAEPFVVFGRSKVVRVTAITIVQERGKVSLPPQPPG